MGLSVGEKIRRGRMRAGIATLPELVRELAKRGVKPPPSTAKLSRIENDKQHVPLDILCELAAIIDVQPRALRPDLAEKLKVRGTEQAA